MSEFTALMQTCEPVQTTFYSSMPTWRPRPGSEQAVARQWGVVDRVTGPAAVALQSVGVLFDYKPRGTMRTVPANAVLWWSTLFDDPRLTAEFVVSQCNMAVGLLDDAIARAAEHEASFEGKVERFVGTPWRLVRAAFGGADYAPRADAVGTLFLTVLAGVIVAFLAHYFHWV